MLYTKGKQQLVLKFNASGSDNLNWFKEDRLRQSQWEDIFTTSKNFFSVTGSCSHTGHCRSFFINHGYGGCPNDAGWLMIGGLEACQWETRFPGNSFQYSKLGSYVVWNTPGISSPIITPTSNLHMYNMNTKFKGRFTLSKFLWSKSEFKDCVGRTLKQPPSLKGVYTVKYLDQSTLWSQKRLW